MNEKIISDLRESLLAIAAKVVRMEARTDALEAVVRVLSMKLGIPDKKVEKLIADLTESQHQKYLERAEQVNPRLGADLDKRVELPELPDELL